MQTEETSLGRTQDGRLFEVPVTEDMLHNLFSHFPPTPQTHSTVELLTLAVVAIQCSALLLILVTYGGEIPRWCQVGFTVSFLMWRAAYNAGLGMLLKNQSETRAWTRWSQRIGIFDAETSSRSPWTKRLHDFVKHDLSKKMGADYDFDQVPIEFNSWLLFRNVVDMVLVNDFTAYIIFAAAHMHAYEQWSQMGVADFLRLVGGVVLIAFNYWVKRDAHRVVKDFAWYWGDFFFLVDKNLTFDGVFEMAPHPMYSVGYAGYYGISMITNSYVVFFVSLIAHAAQFIFLIVVEEPHIKKIYGSPSAKYSMLSGDARVREILYGGDSDHAYFRRDLVVFKNLDLYRSGDLFLVWSILFTTFTALPFPESWAIVSPLWIFVLHAMVWRCILSFGMGLTLRHQSLSKAWTKHFIKHGASHRDAFAHWKIIYNFALTMTYVTFAVACLRMINLPPDAASYFSGSFLLRQAMGTLLILLQIWMSTSVYEVLGDFGWFYGDFFIDEFPSQLHYSGIYRYLNNPEKILGHAAFWGLALMSGSWIMFAVSVVSHLSNWWFLEYVETPHMQKLYGNKIREESGVAKTIRSQIASPMSKLLERHTVLQEVNRVLGAGTDMVQRMEKMVAEGLKDTFRTEVNKIVEVTRPRLDEIVVEAKALLTETKARLSTIGDTDQWQGLDLSSYGVRMSVSALSPLYADSGSGLTFQLGEIITVYWKAPKDHAMNDWIGIYKVTNNSSASLTNVSSHGKWKYLECAGDDIGSCTFENDSLPWECGVYEVRLHYNDKYLVVAKSGAFEIKLDKNTASSLQYDSAYESSTMSSPKASGNFATPFETERNDPASPETLPPSHPNSFFSITSQLLPVYRRALGMPILRIQDHFIDTGHGEEKHARRIAYAIKLLFGIEFSWKVVMEYEPSVERIGERIQEACAVLSPSSMRLIDDTSIANVTDASVKGLSTASLSHFLTLIQSEKDRRRRMKRYVRRKLPENADTEVHTDDSVNGGVELSDADPSRDNSPGRSLEEQ